MYGTSSSSSHTHTMTTCYIYIDFGTAITDCFCIFITMYDVPYWSLLCFTQQEAQGSTRIVSTFLFNMSNVLNKFLGTNQSSVSSWWFICAMYNVHKVNSILHNTLKADVSVWHAFHIAYKQKCKPDLLLACMWCESKVCVKLRLVWCVAWCKQL